MAREQSDYMKFFRKKDRSVVVRDTFRQYVKSYRDFLKIAEQCALKVRPQQRALMQDAFRLQNLLQERQALRFEHLFECETCSIAPQESLTSISARLEGEWSEVEELCLLKSKSYVDVLRQIEVLQNKLDPEALTEPLHALEGESGYREARLDLANRVSEFERRLSA